MHHIPSSQYPFPLIPLKRYLNHHHFILDKDFTLLAEESLTMVTPCLKRLSLASGVVKMFAPERKRRSERKRAGKKDRKAERSDVNN